jgi:hypothetical protein
MQKFMRFPEWKTKAMTLSYDDAVIFDERLIAIMQKYGLKGTFNVNGGMLSSKFYRRMDKEQAIALYKNSGMEVAMHGLDHAFLEGSTGADIVKEYYEDKLVLEKEFGEIMRGGAYAFGVVNDEIVSVLKTLGLSYFRTTNFTDGFSIPKDWLRLQPTCRHSAENLFELTEKFLAAKPNSHYNAKPLLFYLWGHSYEFEDNNNWEIIERFGEMVAASDDIWHATNAEIYDYIKAYEDLIFSAAGDKVFNPSPIDVYLWANRKQVIAKANSVTEIE